MTTMDALTKISYKQQPLLSIHHHRTSFSAPISSISLKTQFARPFPCLLPFKIRSCLSANTPSTAAHYKSSPKPKTQNPFSALSLLKIPLCVAVAAAALFLSGFGHKKLTAMAEPASPPMVETSTQETAEDAVFNEGTEKSLEEFVASHPDDVQALKSLMEAKIKNKKLPEAVEVINRLIELEPDEVEWPLLRAHMYSYMGESELAKSGFEEILAKDPLRVEAFHGLVMAVSQGESDSKELDEVTKRILEAMERSRKEKKKDEVRDFKLLIAQIRVIEGNYVEALKVYQELVKEEPRDFRPYLCQGIIYTLLRKKDEAEKQFEKYKRLVPKGHPYARYFDDNMLATKVFSQMAENERMKMGSKS